MLFKKKMTDREKLLAEIWENSKDLPRVDVKDLDDFESWNENNELFPSSILYENNRIDRYSKNIEYGDIVLVTSFTDLNKNTVIDNKEHRILVITDSGENNVNKRTYFGYVLSSNWEKQSNINNPDKSKNIYINNYMSILSSGDKSIKDKVYIDLGKVCSFSTDELKAGGHIIGKASDEFLQFIKDTLNKIRRNEDTSKVYWIK